ncbi:AAA family ATPase [Nakamurella aerolata]|uniref:AAA family ATPase n=1 Tax=Nakamurella aerolata TaxID=1656892 RepID=A0A849ABG4_9ACTN|nr:AAA family ATPase [Nakamurella aerolata]NNG36926.1 AAA family ATPase [Nakamurella aerolata]
MSDIQETAVYAEHAVIGSALLGSTRSLLELTDGDFTDGRCRLIATTIRDMLRREEHVDTITVADKLFGRVGPEHIHKLASAVPMADAGGWYAGIVRNATRVRVTAQAHRRALQALSGDEPAEVVDQTHTDTISDLEAVPPLLDVAPDADPPTIADLLDLEFTHDWLVPGLMERRERIVLVAAEGAGKSVWLSQIGIALAGGCHPMTGQRIDGPKRVLLIDAENSLQQTQRRFRWIADRFGDRLTVGWARNVIHHIRPEGLDLPGRDRAWLMKVCAAASPDLIIFTPAYKLMRGNPQLDSDVLALLQVMDEVRVRHNAALLIETHTGHGLDETGRRAVRPYGSSVWLRWPEIGIGLTRHVVNEMVMDDELAVGQWRGMREERAWPSVIQRGRDRQLPWIEAGSEYWGAVRRAPLDIPPDPRVKDD